MAYLRQIEARGNLVQFRTPTPSGGTPADGYAVPAGLKLGEPAPPLKLPDLTGTHVDLADLRGEENLGLFWNPGYGLCQHMLPNLKE